MNKEFERLLPELRLKQYYELMRNNILLANLCVEDHKFLVDLVIKRLNAYYNADIIDFMDAEDEISKLPIWMGGLSGLTSRQILSGLITCITGKSSYLDRPPPSVVAFRHVCENSNLPYGFFEEDKVCLPSPEKQESNFTVEDLKKLIPERFWPKKWRESCMNET